MTTLGHKVSVIPSLVISVTPRCDMNCVYCPPSGEDIVPCKSLCNERTILELITIAKERGVEMVRLTGGEPLLLPKRTRTLLEEGTKHRFRRLVLNTNGTQLLHNLNWLSEYAGMFECKVSLDSLDPSVFQQITKLDALETVVKGILCAADQGIEVVINCVISRLNIKSVFDVIDFCDIHSFNLKLFDISDFGRTFRDRWLAYYQPIDDLIVEIERRYRRNPDERLIGGRGRKMASFTLNSGAKLLIINHHGRMTSNLLYSDDCLSCANFPCASGRLCITLRSDGLLSVCRLRPDLGVDVSELSAEEIASHFTGMMETFQCLHFEEANRIGG